MKELLLEDNLITCLPENLDNLVDLKVLTLVDNPLEDPPKEVYTEGIQAIWAHFKKKRNMKIMATKVKNSG